MKKFFFILAFFCTAASAAQTSYHGGAAIPLSVANGGSGAATLTGLLKGNGTSAFTALTIPLSLANGGTGTAITASNGGIFYSDGSAGQLLAGTSTAGKFLRSGASAAPTWSVGFPNSGTLAKCIQGNGTDYVEVDQGTGVASLTSATSGIANTETKIKSSASTMAASRLTQGSFIRVSIKGTCTSTAAGVGIFRIRYGTNGTTADGIIGQFTLSAAPTSGTAIPFAVEIGLVITNGGGLGTTDGWLALTNNGTTGLSATATQVISAGGTNTLDCTTASTFLTVTYISGNANTTSTFQHCVIEIVYK